MISSPDTNIGRQLHEVIRRRLILPVSYWKTVTYTDFSREIGQVFSNVKATRNSPLSQNNLIDHIDAKVNIGTDTQADTILNIHPPCMPGKISKGHGWRVDG